MAATDDTAIGIDLGTTFSCAAYLREGRPRIVPSEKGYATVPSVVGLSKRGEIIVGHPALDQMVVKPADTIYGAKRLVGRKYNSLVVQKMMQTMTYRILEGPNGEAAVMLGGTRYTLTDISGFILSEIRETAQGQLECEINRAVITVPAYYNDNQRQAVKEAGAKAGLNVERIINEPTAAAVAYGYRKGINEKVLVYDLGGGTLDVSILHIHGSRFEVLATGGDTFLGGVDFDTRLSDYILQKFQEASDKDIRDEKVAVQRIRMAAERAKRELSVQKQVNVHLPFITEMNGEPIDLKLVCTRDQLIRLTKDLVEQTLAVVDDVMGSIGMKPSELNEVLLVGGQTRMPLVQQALAQHLGKQPRKGVHPDEVVAMGAAILTAPVREPADVQLRDVLAIPIGIALPNGRFKIVLERNTPIPAAKVYKMTLDRNAPVEIDIYQGDRDVILENEYLGTFSFPATAKERKRTQRLELRFELTAESILSLTARDLDSGEATSAKLVTQQTPKSLRDGMAAAMAGKDSENRPGWFKSFAAKILGK